MNRIAISTAAVLMAAFLLAGCATKKAEQAPAAAEPAATPAETVSSDAALWPSAKPIPLNDHLMPDGGELTNSSPGNDTYWAVHGVADGVAWRFGASDAGFIRVANQPDVSWDHIQVAGSWGVICRSVPESDTTSANTLCRIVRIRPLQEGSMASGGIRITDHAVCAVSDGAMADADIQVDDHPPFRLLAPELCLSGAAAETLQQEMLAGQNVTITAHFQAKGPAQPIVISTYGLKQALNLRTWLQQQVESGKLTAAQ